MARKKMKNSVQSIETTTISNSKLKLSILNIGSTILSIKVRKGSKWVETTLQYEDLESYINNEYYLNSLIGPYSGRVKNGEYYVKFKKMKSLLNDGLNSLHGSQHSIHDKFFCVSKTNDTITTHYFDETLSIHYYNEYKIKGGQLKVKQIAIPKIESVINLTQHLYFNLSNKRDISGHKLMIEADHVQLVDSTNCPTGELLNVANTEFDFREIKEIKVDSKFEHDQFKITKRVDHAFITKGGKVTLESPNKKISLEIESDSESTVIYFGSYMDKGIAIKDRGLDNTCSAIAIEPQEVPNGMNLSGFASQLYTFDKPFIRKTKYIFSVLEQEIFQE